MVRCLDRPPVLISSVVRSSKLTTIVRALSAMLVLAGCARLADLGAGGTSTTSDSGAPVGAGGRTDANIEITPAALDFGEVACGAESPAKLIQIHNSGGAPAPYKAAIAAGTAFRIEGAQEGMILPKETITLSVFAKPGTAGDNVTDLFVTAGEALQPIHTTAKGTGPTFDLLQSTISFGDVRKQNGSAPVDLEVKNTGTAAISVSAFTISDPAFVVEWAGKPGAFNVPPRSSGHLSVTLQGSGTVPDPATLTATIKPNQAKFCGPSPILTVTGRRVTSDVTLSTADWGKQSCLSTPNGKDIVITNYANAVLNYTVELPAPSAFRIVNSGPLLVAAAPTETTPQTATIRVAPNKLPGTAPLPDIKELLGVMLTSSTQQGIAGRRDVALHVNVRGVIVNINPATLTFTSTGAATDTRPFTVENTGNEGAFLNWDFRRTSAGGATSWAYNGPGSVGGPGTANGTVDFKGVGDAGTSTATLTPSQPFFPSSPECKQLGDLTLSGTKP